MKSHNPILNNDYEYDLTWISTGIEFPLRFEINAEIRRMQFS